MDRGPFFFISAMKGTHIGTRLSIRPGFFGLVGSRPYTGQMEKYENAVPVDTKPSWVRGIGMVKDLSEPAFMKSLRASFRSPSEKLSATKYEADSDPPEPVATRGSEGLVVRKERIAERSAARAWLRMPGRTCLVSVMLLCVYSLIPFSRQNLSRKYQMFYERIAREEGICYC